MIKDLYKEIPVPEEETAIDDGCVLWSAVISKQKAYLLDLIIKNNNITRENFLSICTDIFLKYYYKF